MVKGKCSEKWGLLMIREKLARKELATGMTPGIAHKRNNTES